MKSKTTIIAVVAVLLAVAGGVYFVFGKNKDNAIGNDSGQQSSTALGQGDVDNAVESVKKWYVAYIDNKADEACKYVTAKYVQEVAAEDLGADTCEAQVGVGSAFLKAFGIKASDSTYEGRIENNSVIVSVKSNSGDSTEDYEMARENGIWKVNTEIEVESEEEKKQGAYNAVVEEWNGLSQAERDSWYNTDGTGGFDAYAESKGVVTE